MLDIAIIFFKSNSKIQETTEINKDINNILQTKKPKSIYINLNIKILYLKIPYIDSFNIIEDNIAEPILELAPCARGSHFIKGYIGNLIKKTNKNKTLKI